MRARVSRLAGFAAGLALLFPVAAGAQLPPAFRQPMQPLQVPQPAQAPDPAQPRMLTPPFAVPTPPGGSGDTAFGAYQRGQFLTALREATTRVEATPPDPVAMTLMGELHATGLGVPQNEQKALGWYRLAADRGDRNAMFAIGMMHVEGRAGLARDGALARGFFEKAAALGHVAAMYNLGLMAFSGQGGTPDFPAAARWFEKAAALGNADAQYALAVMLKDGNGVAVDLTRSAQLMGDAARQDLPEAQIDYAIMLFNGHGVQKDEAASARLFRRAALRGNPVAMNRYARLLAGGRGVAADPVLAAQWYTLARVLGAEDSWLSDFVARLDPVQRAAAERGAREWMR